MAARKQPTSRTNTRRHRTKAKSAPIPATVVDTVGQNTAISRPGIPSAIAISRRSFGVLRSRWRLFTAMTAVYIAAYLLLAEGLRGLLSLSGAIQKSSGYFADGLNGYAQIVNGLSTTSSEQPVALFTVIFVCSLATIWALRQVYAADPIRLRDAFYKGMYPLIPAAIIVVIMLLQFIPFVLGVNIFATVTTAGIAVNAVQDILWGIGCLGLILVSLYFLTASLFALYIVTLPEMTPLAALRSARQLVAKRRWQILRRAVALPLVLLLVTALLGIVLTPLSAFAAEAVVILLTGASLTIAHAYLYTLYRELIGE